MGVLAGGRSKLLVTTKALSTLINHLLYYFDQFVFDSEFLIQLKYKRNPTNREKIIAATKKTLAVTRDNELNEIVQ
jgi:hypothetical protein